MPVCSGRGGGGGGGGWAGKGREGFPMCTGCHVAVGRAALLPGLGAVRELTLFLFCPFHNLEPFPPSPCKKWKPTQKNREGQGWEEGHVLLSLAAAQICLSHSFSPCPNPALSFRNDVQFLKGGGKCSPGPCLVCPGIWIALFMCSSGKGLRDNYAAV